MKIVNIGKNVITVGKDNRVLLWKDTSDVVYADFTTERQLVELQVIKNEVIVFNLYARNQKFKGDINDNMGEFIAGYIKAPSLMFPRVYAIMTKDFRSKMRKLVSKYVMELSNNFSNEHRELHLKIIRLAAHLEDLGWGDKLLKAMDSDNSLTEFISVMSEIYNDEESIRHAIIDYLELFYGMVTVPNGLTKDKWLSIPVFGISASGPSSPVIEWAVRNGLLLESQVRGGTKHDS